jgi:hypothetical protein
VIVTGVVAGTAVDPYEKMPLVPPAGTKTSAGRVSAGCDPDNRTSTFPPGAGAVRLTQPTPP